MIPGHQIVGVVENTGEKVTGFNIGDKVGVTWFNSTCGRCEYCQQGLENLCDDAKFTGLDVNGGLQNILLPRQSMFFLFQNNFHQLRLHHSSVRE